MFFWIIQSVKTDWIWMVTPVTLQESQQHHSLCSHTRWYAHRRRFCSWGPGTAGLKVSSLIFASGSSGASAPPAGCRQTRPCWATGTPGRWETQLKWDSVMLLPPSHLCSDAHRPWHTGISATLLQLPTVMFMLLSFGAQLWLPVTPVYHLSPPYSTNDDQTCLPVFTGFDWTYMYSSSVDDPIPCPPGVTKINQYDVARQVLCNCSSCSRRDQYLLTVFCRTDLSDCLNTLVAAAEGDAGVLSLPPPVSHLHMEVNEHATQYSS